MIFDRDLKARLPTLILLFSIGSFPQARPLSQPKVRLGTIRVRLADPEPGGLTPDLVAQGT
jgi:hypothetical protein